jgi:hypothetical protein
VSESSSEPHAVVVFGSHSHYDSTLLPESLDFYSLAFSADSQLFAKPQSYPSECSTTTIRAQIKGSIQDEKLHVANSRTANMGII